MRNTLRTVAVLGAIALIAALGVTAFASGGSGPTTILPASSSSPSDEPTASESPGGDISGPCDEAEHANDPECRGVTATPSASGTPTATPSMDDDDDISGPCDEAEHANDPECQDGVDDDSSGPGNGDDQGDNDDHSGPGNGDDQGDNDDHSGPGNGDNQGDNDDHSGPGNGDDDND